MAAVKITELKQQLMKRIDANDLVQIEKVERYIDLVKTFRKMNKIISREGETVVTENGAQRFVKANPLIGERNKVNASLLSIEKSFNFDHADENEKDTKKKSSLSDLMKK